VRLHSGCGFSPEAFEQELAARGWPAESNDAKLRRTTTTAFIDRRTRVSVGVFLILLMAQVAWPQSLQSFSGVWKQDNDRSQPKRTGNVTLRIDYREPQLTVDTTISRESEPSRHAVQTYSTDGKVSVSTGADGDEFHTSVIRKEATLVFSIEEHEDGRVLRSNEIWSLDENGFILQRVRERPDGERQIVLYRRQQPSPAGQDP
jgi:hypothetical protein